MKNPIVLFRGDLDMEDELAECRRHLQTVEYRSQVPQNSTVISRFSALPYYQELERELNLSGSKLLNSYAQHKWIADMMDWGGEYGVLTRAKLTPPSYVRYDRLPEGSYIVKGRTNSRKHQWKTHMFAKTKADIPDIARRLNDDTLIQDQGIVVRPYVPLKKLADGLNGLPIVNEWRTFWLTKEHPRGGKVAHQLARGFYWQASHPEVASKAYWTEQAEGIAQDAAYIVAQDVNFFVLDLAQTEAGDWIVIEVNDGQMSGLCGCNARDLYFNLARLTNEEL